MVKVFECTWEVRRDKIGVWFDDRQVGYGVGEEW